MERHSMQLRMYIQKAVTLCGQDQYSPSGQARQGIPCSPEMIVLVDCYHSGARLFTNVAYNYSPLCVENICLNRPCIPEGISVSQRRPEHLVARPGIPCKSELISYVVSETETMCGQARHSLDGHASQHSMTSQSSGICV